MKMNTLKVINWIKGHLLQLVGGFTVACLIGVAVYARNSDKAQREYTVDVMVYGDTAKEMRFTTHGFPRLTRYRSGYELTGYSHVLYKTKDSCEITSIKMN